MSGPNDLKVCELGRERVGGRRWQVDVALPDNDPMLAGAGTGTSNVPGDPMHRLIFYGRTADVIERLGSLLLEAASELREIERSSSLPSSHEVPR